MLLRALAIWCGLLVVAFLNGAVRLLWLTPTVGDSAAHLLSALILSTLVIVVAWRAIAWLHPHSANEAMLIGDEWVLLTIAFEFLAGYYAFETCPGCGAHQISFARGKASNFIVGVGVSGRNIQSDWRAHG